MTICVTGLQAKSIAKIDCKNDESQLNTAAQYYTYTALSFSFFGLQSNHLLICYRVLRFIVGLQYDHCLPSLSGWASQLFRSCCCLHQVHYDWLSQLPSSLWLPQPHWCFMTRDCVWAERCECINCLQENIFLPRRTGFLGIGTVS